MKSKTAKICMQCRSKEKTLLISDEERKKRAYNSAKISYSKNVEYYRGKHHQYHVANKKIIQQKSKKFYEKNRQKIISKHKNQREKLNDIYIRQRISSNTILTTADVPQKLVELYKLKLIAERMLKNVITETNHN